MAKISTANSLAVQIKKAQVAIAEQNDVVGAEKAKLAKLREDHRTMIEKRRRGAK